MLDFLNKLQNDPAKKRNAITAVVGSIILILFVAIYLLSSQTKTTSTVMKDDSLFAMDTTGLVVNVFLRTAIVFGLMFLFFALLKKWQGRKITSPQKRMAVVESIRLSPKQAIHLIKVGNREFLVGATDQNMNLISELEVGVEPLVEQESIETQGQNFASILNQSLDVSKHLFNRQPKSLS